MKNSRLKSEVTGKIGERIVEKNQTFKQIENSINRIPFVNSTKIESIPYGIKGFHSNASDQMQYPFNVLTSSNQVSYSKVNRYGERE